MSFPLSLPDLRRKHITKLEAYNVWEKAYGIVALLDQPAIAQSQID